MSVRLHYITLHYITLHLSPMCHQKLLETFKYPELSLIDDFYVVHESTAKFNLNRLQLVHNVGCRILLRKERYVNMRDMHHDLL